MKPESSWIFVRFVSAAPQQKFSHRVILDQRPGGRAGNRKGKKTKNKTKHKNKQKEQIKCGIVIQQKHIQSKREEGTDAPIEINFENIVLSEGRQSQNLICCVILSV